MIKEYSQYGEDKILLDLSNQLGINNGRLLDIGAYHPEVFSNSRLLILNGWSGILVEPSVSCAKTIENFYKNDTNIIVENIAITDYDGMIHFYDSDGAVATTVKHHYDIWKNIQLDYRETDVPCLSWSSFYKKHGGTFNLINIDTEGLDNLIIKQINLDETKTQIVCIEHSYNFDSTYDYLTSFGFSLLTQTNENSIFFRFYYE